MKLNELNEKSSQPASYELQLAAVSELWVVAGSRFQRIIYGGDIYLSIQVITTFRF